MEAFVFNDVANDLLALNANDLKEPTKDDKGFS